MMAREREWGPAKDLAPAFAKSILSNPYFKKVPQMGSEELELYLKAEDKTVVFVDARPPVMTKVSTIPEALIVPVSFGVEDGMKKLIVDEEKLKELPDATLEGADVIVAYCGTGIRGCLLTEALVKLKPGKKVANLCGGLIDWYNRMHKVVNGAGEEVKARNRTRATGPTRRACCRCSGPSQSTRCSARPSWTTRRRRTRTTWPPPAC